MYIPPLKTVLLLEKKINLWSEPPVNPNVLPDHGWLMSDQGSCGSFLICDNKVSFPERSLGSMPCCLVASQPQHNFFQRQSPSPQSLLLLPSRRLCNSLHLSLSVHHCPLSLFASESILRDCSVIWGSYTSVQILSQGCSHPVPSPSSNFARRTSGLARSHLHQFSSLSSGSALDSAPCAVAMETVSLNLLSRPPPATSFPYAVVSL